MRSKLFKTLMTVVATLFLLLGLNQQLMAASNVIEMRAISFLPAHAPNTEPLMHFIDSVNDKLKGKVKINYAGGPEVISGREQIESIRNGIMDIGLNMAGASSGVVPEFKALMPSMMDASQLRNSGYLALLDEAAKKRANIHYLAHLSGNFAFYLFWNPEVKNPRTDFKGIKLRGGGSYNPGIKALGAEPISVALSELYSAMQRGIVDGMGQPLVGILEHPGIEKTIKYGHVMNLAAGGAELFVNLDKWNSLPSEIKEEITAIAIEAEQWAIKYYEDVDKKSLSLLEKAGVEIADWGSEGNKYFENIWRDALLADIKKQIPDSYEEFAKILNKK